LWTLKIPKYLLIWLLFSFIFISPWKLVSLGRKLVRKLCYLY
jgi:hypothetical protein